MDDKAIQITLMEMLVIAKLKIVGLLVSLFTVTASSLAWADCPIDALGTSRTLTLPRNFAAYGAMQHEPLPLAEKEVVLTFDDGPRPGTTDRVLEALAAECVKATFLTVGANLRNHPDLARKLESDGHSVGIHSDTHAHMSQLKAADQLADLEKSIYAYRDVYHRLPPAYRFPFLEETPVLMAAMKELNITVLSLDLGIDDWQPSDTSEVLKNRLLSRLGKNGKGIILLHDANGPTAEALPVLLRALKEANYRVVHLEWTP